MPRIHRNSLKLYYQLQARPVRQPLLDFAKDDDIVAAYIGYDNITDLNKLRLTPMLLSAVAIDYTPKYRPDELLPALRLLVTTQRTCPVKEATDWFEDNAAILHRRGKLCEESRWWATRLAWWPVYYSRPANFPTLVDGGIMKECQPEYCENNKEILDKLPDIDPKSVKLPKFMEHEEDLEGCVRMVMVAETIKEVLRPSVWARKFPKSGKTKEQIEAAELGAKMEKFEKVVEELFNDEDRESIITDAGIPISELLVDYRVGEAGSEGGLGKRRRASA